jgi:hypothetical protein
MINSSTDDVNTWKLVDRDTDFSVNDLKEANSLLLNSICPLEETEFEIEKGNVFGINQQILYKHKSELDKIYEDLLVDNVDYFP